MDNDKGHVIPDVSDSNAEKEREHSENGETIKQSKTSTSGISKERKSRDNKTSDEHVEVKETHRGESNSPEAAIGPEWTVEKLNREFRKFNIDLHPRVSKTRSNSIVIPFDS